MAIVVACAFLSACATTERLPAVPLALASSAAPLDIPEARFYPDADSERIAAMATEAFERARAAGQLPKQRGAKHQPHFLAISGGGDDGAFGAGLLTGWTERGDRPEFSIVTGVSTGALAAPFAFLGPAYDEQLKKIYTETSAKDVFEPRMFMAAIADDAMADTAPLRATISRYLDQQMVQRIAEEYNKGRNLLIMTTNLDQSRSVIWSIGAIASSGHPRARELIVDILLASAALPGLFPPVMVDVMIDGVRYQEMHVDGGAVAQAFLYPPTFNLKKQLKKWGIKGAKPKAYIIRNGRPHRPEQNVERKTLKIAQEAIETMTASSGLNDMYRMYLTTKRDGVEFNLAYISDEFDLPYKGPFNTEYMNTLFQHGYEIGRAGYPWHNAPPGYAD